MKRTFDLVTSLICLVLLSPLFLAIALLVKFESRGPVFSSQQCVGRNGNQFRLYRFRTGLAGSILGGLPQLLNVIRGDMSLVGPRLESLSAAGRAPLYKRLLVVRPGMIHPGSPQSATSIAAAQTTAPNQLTSDLRYVLHNNLWIDLRIVGQAGRRIVGVDSLASGPVRRLVRRHGLWLLLDAVVVILAFYSALFLRLLDFPSKQIGNLLVSMSKWAGLLAVLYPVMNSIWGVNRRIWRFATAADVRPIIGATSLATLLATAADIYLSNNGPRLLPLGILLLAGLFSACGMVVIRYGPRLLRGLSVRGRNDGESTRTIIYGAGDAGQHLALRLLTHESGAAYDLVGFADDDPRKRGKKIHGLPVLGSRCNLAQMVDRRRVALIIIAINNIRGEDLRQILTVAQRTVAQIRIIPNVLEVVSIANTAPFHREVRVEDLLGRQPVQLDRPRCERVLRHRVVLVTGGCGSVGSELCRQVAQFAPKQLVVLDNNETGLYDLELVLRASFPKLPLSTVVADVTHASRIDTIFSRLKPDVIFHAAAYKHVPLMERFPQEAVRVNVGGTAVVLRMAKRHSSTYFVLVSTDKAVEPHSVMGATKRIAEMLVVGEYGGNGQGGTRCTAVRFGNVLGSRGSVVPTFAKQIDAGGPVTVTHPDMTRYFMDVSEAAGLIIEAASLTKGHDIFMLEMGERIRVDDLARKMIRMRGLRPEIDIPIVYTGVRPGEKLHEELVFSEEGREPTEHPLVHRLLPSVAASNGELATAVGKLLELSKNGKENALVGEVMKLAHAGRQDGASVSGPDPEDLSMVLPIRLEV